MATYKDVLMLVDKVSEPLKKIQGNTDKLRDKLGRLQGGIKKVGTALTAVGATVAVVGGAVIRGANQFAEMGDRIDKMSQKIGMSRESFQEWDYILSQNGGNIDSLQMGFKTLTTQIGMAGKGTKESVAMFKQLGVSVKDNNGNLRKQDDVFNDTITALQKMGETTERDVIAQKLFGRSFIEVKPLLNQSAEAIDKLRKKANDMGLILSKEDVDNARDFKDTMDTFTRFFQAKFATVMMKLMPQFSKALEDIMKFANENQEVFNSIGVAFSFIVTKALPAVIKSIVFVANILRGIGGFIGNIIGGIMSIPARIQMAFNTLKTNVMIILINIGKFIQKIIDSIQWVVGKIPSVGKVLQGGGRVTQTQNNNSTSNVTNITNNYGGGGYGGLTPLTSGVYAVP